MKKIWSLRYWGHVFRKSYRLLRSPNIPIREKLMFGIPVLLYWVLPDVMPYLPIDDIGVTMIVANWFANRMERKYPTIR